MNAKHTPGPCPICRENHSVRSCDEYHSRIARIYAWRGHIFAAAPETAAERDRLKALNAELLAALKHLDDVANEPNGHPHGWDAAMVEASDKARAAIAKATP